MNDVKSAKRGRRTPVIYEIEVVERPAPMTPAREAARIRFWDSVIHRALRNLDSPKGHD